MKKFFLSAALVSALLIGATSCQSNVDKAVNIAKQIIEASAKGDYDKVEKLTEQGEALNLTEEEEAKVQEILAKEVEKITEAATDAANKVLEEASKLLN